MSQQVSECGYIITIIDINKLIIIIIIIIYKAAYY